MKTISSNRKLPLKPLRKLEKNTFARAFKFFSPVIALVETRLAERGEKSLRLKIGGEND